MKRVKFIEKKLPYEIEEEMKLLRTNIQFCGEDKKVIMLTSCIAGEGKSVLSLDLAKSLTELDKKVVLVDCDLRRSVLIKQVSDGKVDQGLSHFLSGQCPFNEVLYATDIPGLAVVFAGVVPPNPTELLSGPIFEKMIQTLREAFDYVIVDCAPIGMVIDAAIVGQRCDGIIMVLESGMIRRKFADESLKKMEKTGKPILGAILNKVDHEKDGKYYGSYYGGYYGRRYKKYYKAEE